MSYTITKNEDGFTNLDAADYMIKMFDFLQKGPAGWRLFTLLNGGQFDYMRFTPDDYVLEKVDGYVNTHGWELDIGNGWAVKAHLSPARAYRAVAPGGVTLTVVFRYKNNWCYRPSFDFTNGVLNQMPDVPKHAEAIWKSIFIAIKRRAAITIREHRNYLANPSFYDTLEQELNIKVRKKK